MNYDLIGLGLGPFNLSLAALFGKSGKRALFLDRKKSFSWHSGLMFEDATMQNSWLKDLVTPADPTNAMSFLNFLVERGLFYSFVNTGRSSITRMEFEAYCQWVTKKIPESLRFGESIREVLFDNGFTVKTDSGEFKANHLSLATGLVPRIPGGGIPHLGKNVFHAVSGNLAGFSAEGKRVLIIGGGQTGIEVFRNCLNGKWGEATSLRLVTPRPNLQPLDESPFTNEYFTPEYVKDFYHLDKNLKESIVDSQKLASDGNTPSYLQLIYNDLYLKKFAGDLSPEIKILTSRRMISMTNDNGSYQVGLSQELTKKEEILSADVVIFATGFRNVIPECLDPIRHLIPLDNKGRLIVGPKFDVAWEHARTNNLFAMNFGRHQLGIAEPQTSLMAWRSATIINHLCGSGVYPEAASTPGVLDHGH